MSSSSPQNGLLESQEYDEVKPTWDLHNAWQQPAAYPTALFRTTRRHVLKTAQTWLWGRGGREGGAPNKDLRPTAWLDGLRGFAAFMVYWHHHELWAHDSRIIQNAWGWTGEFYLIQLPGIRLIFNGGHLAVSTFFIISGYVLSLKGLSLIQESNFDALSANVGSALFRRWIRLYLPCIATTFCYFTTWHLFGLWCAGIKALPTWWAELGRWYVEFKNFSFVFRLGGDPWFKYNMHLWSIPMEFRGSLIIFTAVLAFSRCSRNMRLCGQLALMYYFLYIADGWYGTLFVSGMLMADLNLLAARNDLPTWMANLAPYRTFLAYHALVAALYLGGVPSESREMSVLRESRGWFWLSFLKPQAVFDYKWFYLVLAAISLVTAIQHLPWLRRFFETRFCQYLGRISFSLYLVHGPICWSLGDRLYRAVGFGKPGLDLSEQILWWNDKLPLPMTGPYGLEFAFLLPNIILLPFTLWLADVVTRLFDEPSVRFASWLYKKTLGPPVTR